MPTYRSHAPRLVAVTHTSWLPRKEKGSFLALATGYSVAAPQGVSVDIVRIATLHQCFGL